MQKMNLEEYKQTEEYQKFQKQRLTRERIIAVVMAISMLISVFFIIYSQNKTWEAEKMTLRYEEQKTIASNAQEQAEKAAADARRAEAIAYREKQAADEARASAQQKVEELKKALKNCGR